MLWMLIGCPVVCLCICCPLFFYYKPRNPLLGSCFKSLGTVCALLPSLTAALKLDPLYWIISAALALHAVADFLLEYSFIGGMGVFLLGHICYAAAFIQLFPLSISHLILFVFMEAVLVYFLYKDRKIIGKNLPPFAVYGTVLIAVLSIALSGGLSAYSLQGGFIAAGAALFVFSDLLIFRNILHPSSSRSDSVIMILYYSAQLLYGLSGFFH